MLKVLRWDDEDAINRDSLRMFDEGFGCDYVITDDANVLDVVGT
jgi:hypothetical protein